MSAVQRALVLLRLRIRPRQSWRNKNLMVQLSRVIKFFWRLLFEYFFKGRKVEVNDATVRVQSKKIQPPSGLLRQQQNCKPNNKVMLRPGVINMVSSSLILFIGELKLFHIYLRTHFWIQLKFEKTIFKKKCMPCWI